MHKKQLYIQESVKLQQLIPKVVKTQELLGIPWKPYPASKNALALLEEDQNYFDPDIGTEGKTTALSVLYGTEYINGKRLIFIIHVVIFFIFLSCFRKWILFIHNSGFIQTKYCLM